jgi:hypothetical protein
VPDHAHFPQPPPSPADDSDSPWKAALEVYFPQAPAPLARDLHAAIDGSRPPEFMDKALQSIGPPGKRVLFPFPVIHLENFVDAATLDDALRD